MWIAHAYFPRRVGVDGPEPGSKPTIITHLEPGDAPPCERAPGDKRRPLVDHLGSLRSGSILACVECLLLVGDSSGESVPDAEDLWPTT